MKAQSGGKNKQIKALCGGECRKTAGKFSQPVFQAQNR